VKVLVIGCGPAGLIAAEAAFMCDAKVKIVSRKVKSPMPGAQYLHRPIPGISPAQPSGRLNYIKLGTRQGYAAKVYGDPNAAVSWDSYREGLHQAWSLSETYDTLWERWEKLIHDQKMNGQHIRFMCNNFDLVISTVPAPILCRGGHEFKEQQVWITDKAWSECPLNSIVYNGAEDDWYRTSRIFGHEHTEYAHPVPAGRVGVKPISTNCDCGPDNLLRAGRFGKWNKHVLVHHVWEEVMGALHAL
jgi:hypothetical protein